MKNLTVECYKKLYDSYVNSYGRKYCLCEMGYSCKLSVEEYYKLFGTEEFVLNSNTEKYTRVDENFYKKQDNVESLNKYIQGSLF